MGPHAQRLLDRLAIRLAAARADLAAVSDALAGATAGRPLPFRPQPRP